MVNLRAASVKQTRNQPVTLSVSPTSRTRYCQFTLGTPVCKIQIFSTLKLCLATVIHSFKSLKITWISEIEVPTNVSVCRYKTYFTFNY